MAALLLLASTALLWGLCSRHNSPPASSGMHFILYCPDSSHVSVDTFHPSLLWSSSSSAVPSRLSIFRRFLGIVSSRVQTTPLSFFCNSLWCTLPSVSPWCYHFSRGFLVFGISTHLHLNPFQFLHVGASHRQYFHLEQHSWLHNPLVNLSINMWWYPHVACDPEIFLQFFHPHRVLLFTYIFMFHCSKGAYQIFEFGDLWQLENCLNWHFLLAFHSDMCTLSLLWIPSSHSFPRLLSSAKIPPSARLSPLRITPHHPLT